MSEYPGIQPKKTLDDYPVGGTLFDPDNAVQHTPQDLDDEADRRLDQVADKLGSYELARTRLGMVGASATVNSETSLKPPRSREKAQRRRRASRRGGRSYPEGSDSDLDPFWNGSAPSDPITTETREINRVGAERARKLLRRSNETAPTVEEIAAAKEADAASIRAKAHESWARYEDNNSR